MQSTSHMKIIIEFLKKRIEELEHEIVNNECDEFLDSLQQPPQREPSPDRKRSRELSMPPPPPRKIPRNMYEPIKYKITMCTREKHCTDPRCKYAHSMNDIKLWSPICIKTVRCTFDSCNKSCGRYHTEEERENNFKFVSEMIAKNNKFHSME
jgi:hypothetical protein